jgi:hypothetical protein
MNTNPSKSSTTLFWILLFLPAAMGLASYAIGQSSKDIGAGIGMLALPLGLGASIYCGIWLARRFFESTTNRVLSALCFTVLIGFANLFAIAAGCVGNLDFR